MDARILAEQNKIFQCISGSRGYGTNLPTSDVDHRGIFIAPPEFILSCHKSIEQVEQKVPDTVIYELRKFMKLAAEANPNLIELLYMPDDCIEVIQPAFQMLQDNRHLFLSKKARFTFSGYAMAQMKRIRGHHKWISNPQAAAPPLLSNYCKFIGIDGQVKRDQQDILALSEQCFLAETFGRTQFRVYTSQSFFKEKLGFFNENQTDVRFVNVHDDILIARAEYQGVLWINYDEFSKAYEDWKGYWDWKKNRNAARAELEEKYKFDVKHALHLVRLMRMCQEILTEGKVLVRRPDAQELLRIRNGEFDYDWLLKWAEESDAKLDEMYEKSTLQHSADYEAIDNLYREIIMRYWKEKGLLSI